MTVNEVAALGPKRIWGNVPARNPGFTGREPLLAAVRDALAAGDRAVVQALHGMGGVGKTQLAIEYTHRHADDYDVIWWLNSETATLLGEQFAALAAELSCAASGAPLDAMRRAVQTALRGRDRWLLVFDNAVRPEDIAAWIPGGNGHVLITSRAQNWHELATPVEVDVFSRAESVAMLRRRVPHLSEEDADRVAEAVGDLPLAVAQAAGYMALTDIPSGEYIGLLGDRPGEILDLGKPWAYPRSLAAATVLSFDQMRAEDPAAADVAAICAFLAHEPVPAEWFVKAASSLPKRLRGQAADPIAWRQVIARLRGGGLVRVNPDGLLMHRLTQAIIRERIPPGESAFTRALAVNVLVANNPGAPNSPARWPAWAKVLPHLLALDPANSDDAGLRNLAARGTRYLIERGDARVAVGLARQVYDRWRVKLGEDHPETRESANNLATALRMLGKPGAVREARDLHADLFARCSRVLGPDHPDTLVSADNLANALYGLKEFGKARDLHRDTLERRRQVLGEDHPETLASAGNLAGALYGLGEFGEAQAIYRDVLARCHQVLGPDHPDTLTFANNLAAALRVLGELEEARDLHRDTLERRRQVLGEDHPDTRTSESNLTVTIRALGRGNRANRRGSRP